MSLLPATRIGMIVPSSNTCLEPVTSRLLVGRDDVGVYSARLRVTRIAMDADSDDQFGTDAILVAARQLADARVDLIVWNGTAGMWLGLEHDRALCAAIQADTGIPATTSALALMAALRHLGVRRVGLANPYTEDVNEQIRLRLAEEDFEVGQSVALGLEENFAFATLPAGQVEQMVRDSADGAEAVAVVCTNVAAALLGAQLEDELGVPICDSVAVTLWHALRSVNADAALPGWGRLYASDGQR